MDINKSKQFESKINNTLINNHKWYFKYQSLIKSEMFMSEINRRAFIIIRDALLSGDHIDTISLVAKDDAFTDLMLVPMALDETEFLHAIQTITFEYETFEMIKMFNHSIKLLERDSGACINVKNTVMERLNSITNTKTRQLTNMEILQQLTNRMESGSSIAGVTTGYYTLDRVISGMVDSALICVAARPSQGKTAFAINMMIRQAMEGQNVVFFNIEMNVTDLMARIIAAHKKQYLSNIISGNISMDVWHTKYLTGLDFLNNITIIDNISNVNDVIAEIYQLKHSGKCDVAYIDYLQLMNGAGKDKNEKYGNISKLLKATAKMLSFPIVLLSQLSRECEKRPDKRPVLSDLRDSGEIEANIDVCIMVYRLEQYKIFEDASGQSTRGIMYATITKNRNGALEDIIFKFIGASVRVEDMDEFHANIKMNDYANENDFEQIDGKTIEDVGF